jgi:hypothetical protein
MFHPRRHARLVLATAILAALPATQAAAYTVQSPDAHDANLAAQRQGDVDLRSPDARDAARGIHVASVVAPPAPAAHHHDDNGAAIGGLVGGLVLIGTGTGLIVARRRGTVRKTRAAAVA